ncbi:MAG: methylmalonyl-CoA epimerase [Thermoplasmata archaeon]|nr:methylmalonyl-CoA epimerase [Thermoplasmata archaeon]
MLEKIDHIGIAVNNLDEAQKLYTEILGLKVQEIEEVAEQKVRVAIIPVGESRIELLESTDPEGPIARYIAKCGEGIQHLAVRVDNIEQVLADLKANGTQLIDETPRLGAGGAKIAFVHPKGTNGILLELCERPE